MQNIKIILAIIKIPRIDFEQKIIQTKKSKRKKVGYPVFIARFDFF